MLLSCTLIQRNCGSQICGFTTGKELFVHLTTHQWFYRITIYQMRCSTLLISIYFSVNHEDYEQTDVIVYSNGRCWWIPPLNTHTYCSLDFTYWPWDIQKCKISFGSWTRMGWEIRIDLGYIGNKANVSIEWITPIQFNSFEFARFIFCINIFIFGIS